MYSFAIVSTEKKMQNSLQNKTGKEYKDELTIEIKNTSQNTWEEGKARFECAAIYSNLYFEPIEINQNIQPNQKISLNLLFARSPENDQTGNILTVLQFLYDNQVYNQESLLFKKTFNSEGVEIEKKLRKEMEKWAKWEEEREKAKNKEIIKERIRVIEATKKFIEQKKKQIEEEEKNQNQKKEEEKLGRLAERNKIIEKNKQLSGIKKKEKEEIEKNKNDEEDKERKKRAAERNRIIQEAKRKREEEKKRKEEEEKRRKEEEEKERKKRLAERNRIIQETKRKREEAQKKQ